jgi:hypothetical protein
MNGDSPIQPTPPTNDGNWQYVPSPPPQPYAPAMSMPGVEPPQFDTPPPVVTWTASEFIAHQKSLGWYGMLVAATMLIATAVYFLTKDKVSVIVVLTLSLLFGISAARKPRTLTFQLDGHGLAIGQKFYAYSEFKSFSVNDEGPFANLDLLPLKRFMPPVSVYYEAKDDAAILQLISQYLPLEQRSNDFTDRLARHIRF